MQIQNEQVVVGRGRGKERPVELKNGEVYQVKVKEARMGEATVQLRGKEIQVAVTGAVKAGEKATMEVMGERNGKAVMKPLPNASVVQKNIAETTFQMKHVKKEVNQALDSFLKQGVPLTKEAVADLQQFFKQAKGTDAEKLQTAQALASKQLVPTSAHLKAVHEALFGEPLQKTVQSVAKALNVPLEITKEHPITALKQQIEKEPQRVVAFVKEALPTFPKEVQRQIKAAVEEAENNPAKAREIVTAALEKLSSFNQKETNNGIKEQMNHQPQGTKIEALHQKVAQTNTKEQAIDTIRQAVQSGAWTTKERAFLTQALQTAETLPKNSRDYLLQQIKAMDTVRQIKEESNKPNVRESVKNLTQILKKTESFKGTASLKESIEKVEKLIQFGRTAEAKEMLTKAVRDFEKSVQQLPKHSLETIGEMKETLAKEPDFSKAIERMTTQVRESSFSVRSMEKAEQLLQQATQLYSEGQGAKSRQLVTQGLEKMTKEVLEHVKQEVTREPNVQKAIEMVKRVANHSTLSKEVSTQLQKVAQEAEVLQKVNRGQEAKVRIVNQLNQFTTSHQSVEQAVERVQKEVSTRLELPKDIQSKVHLQNQLRSLTGAKEIIDQTKERVKRAKTTQQAVDIVKPMAKHQALPKDVAEKLQKVIQEVEVLSKIGRSAAAKTRLENQLTNFSNQLAKTETTTLQKVGQEAEQLLKNSEETKASTHLQAASMKMNQAGTIAQLENVAQTEPVKEAIQKVENTVSKGTNVSQEVKTKVQEIIEQAKQLVTQGKLIEAKQTVTNGLQLVKEVDAKNIGNENRPLQEKITTTKVEALKQQLQKEPNVNKMVDSVLQAVKNVNPSLKERVETQVEEATELNEKGREMKARKKVQEALQMMMEQAEKPQDTTTAEQSLQKEEAEWMQSVQNFTSKDLVVTRVTEKLAQVAIDFKQTKRDLMKNLDRMELLTKQFQKNAAPQIRQMLESTIKTLDQSILKSDMMMLTDMKTEKKLIQASSQLAEAKKLLDKGDLKGVERIVRNVKGMLSRLQFKPQDVRLQHFVMKEEENLNMYKPQEQLIRSFTETLRTQTTFEHSARGMFEQVRQMGLNYDSEIGQILASDKEMTLSRNMKQALLQLASGKDNGPVQQAAEQALHNLTGQQLLSKSDHGTTPQHLFFSLPLLMNKNVQNVQVYIHSKNQGEKVDWENCSLYFLLDTKTLGETGVLVNVVDRQLSLTLKNNLPDFPEKVTPLVEKATERLQEIGYQMSSIQFGKLVTQTTGTKENEPREETNTMPIFTEKGFDFTI